MDELSVTTVALLSRSMTKYRRHGSIDNLEVNIEASCLSGGSSPVCKAQTPFPLEETWRMPADHMHVWRSAVVAEAHDVGGGPSPAFRKGNCNLYPKACPHSSTNGAPTTFLQDQIRPHNQRTIIPQVYSQSKNVTTPIMSTTVHVKGISHQTSEKEVRDFFSFW